jgi:hypothetical protein
MSMMLIVADNPPAIAPAEQQVGKNQPERIIHSISAENLPVARVMEEESQLRANNGHQYGIQDLQLEILNHRQQNAAQNEQPDRGNDLKNVISWLPVEKAPFFQPPP